MGFGYLFIGYLITFIISMTVQSIGFGGLAVLIGYGIMYYALWQLNRYHRAFVWARWLLLPLAVTAIYDLLQSLDELFLWQLSVTGGTVATVLEWLTFALILIFNLALLYGIRMLSEEVGLKHMATAAVRNMLFVALYAFLSIVARFPLPESVKNYLTLPIILLDLVWIVCNLVLIVSCAKNICPAGDEDQPAKPSRFAWINRIGDAYERNRQKSIHEATEHAEEILRRRREKQAQKNKKRRK